MPEEGTIIIGHKYINTPGLRVGPDLCDVCGFPADRHPDPVNPSHYRSHPSGIECIEITRHLSFDVGNAVKYVWRADAKNGREDLEKARWYLEDAIRHTDRVFLSSWRSVQDRALHRVVWSETDHNKAGFFDSLRNYDLNRALKAVNAMLDGD